MRRFLPIVDWLPKYDRRWLRGDVAAGIAVTALIVPKNLGYAGIAGVPLQNGLYAAAAGALIYAVFCTSRQISTGPSSSLAAVAGGAVLVTGLGGDQAAQLVAAITLLTGSCSSSSPLLKLGWIAQFLSKAVVTGFLAGAAVDVVIGELPKLTGTSSDGDSAWRELGSWARTLGDIHWATLLVGVVALAVILALRFTVPAIPGALVLVVGGLLASAIFDLERPRRRGRRRRAARAPGADAAGLRHRPAQPLGDRDRGGGAAADRLLADGRRRPGVRDPAPLPHRRRPGVGGAGDGERRRRRVPGHAGVDQPVGELAERVGRRADAGGLARHGGPRARDPDRAGAAVLGAAEGGARRRSSSTRSCSG